MPQISPLPWVLMILILVVLLYTLQILMWYSSNLSLKFN